MPQDIQWHFIGVLQTNKIKYCPSLFHTIHTIHRIDIAEKLNKKCEETDTYMNILIQMNLTVERTKSGLHSEEELQMFSDTLLSLSRLRLKGLMTIPDPNFSAKETQSLYAKLYEMNGKEAKRLGLEKQMVELSMGMSNDFEDALAEGATYLRIGTEIFGPR